jgi:CheY-like chemotaxis protein
MAAAADQATLGRMRILLVEDSWQLGIALKGLLQSLGLTVAGPVATSADAERLASAQLPDLALVDINLRGGEQAYGLIDRLLDLGIRVIVTSGYAELPMLPARVSAVLQKPIKEAQLLAILEDPSGPTTVA